jgi:hypothetical protein
MHDGLSAHCTAQSCVRSDRFSQLGSRSQRCGSFAAFACSDRQPLALN